MEIVEIVFGIWMEMKTIEKQHFDGYWNLQQRGDGYWIWKRGNNFEIEIGWKWE